MRLKYKKEQNVLAHKALQQVDTSFFEALVATTKNMHGYSKKMLYMTRARGGLEIPLFSDQAAVRKLQKLFSCTKSQQLHAHAAGGALSRLARKQGYFATKRQGIIINSAPIRRNDRKLFCNGLAEWLKDHQLYFCRRELRPRDASLSNMLMMIISDDDEALRMTCRTLSV